MAPSGLECSGEAARWSAVMRWLAKTLPGLLIATSGAPVAAHPLPADAVWPGGAGGALDIAERACLNLTEERKLGLEGRLSARKRT